MKLSINAGDLAVRALHTFWQSFLAALAVVWAASGINVSQVDDMASAKKIALSAVLAVVAAALSALKSTVATVVSTTKFSDVIDTGPGWSDEPTETPTPVDVDVDQAVAVPSDPDQPAAGAPPARHPSPVPQSDAPPVTSPSDSASSDAASV